MCGAVTAESLRGLIPEGSFPSLEIDLPELLAAPVKVGQVLGEARMTVQGETICTVELTASADVKERTYHSDVRRIIGLWR